MRIQYSISDRFQQEEREHILRLHAGVFVSISYLFPHYFHLLSTSKVEDTVGEHATLFKEHYYVKPSGNCDLSRMSDPHNEFEGKNVLIERSSTDAMASKFSMPIEKYVDALGTCRRELFSVRSTRPRPHLDDKVSNVPRTKGIIMLLKLLSCDEWYGL